MTVVVAYTNANECRMSFDSAASSSDMIITSNTPKAIKHAGGGLIGIAGSWRVINLISSLKSRRVSPAMIIEKLKNVKGEDDSIKEMEILCAWPNRPLVIIQNDFSAIEVEQSFMAIGSGAPYALGYLESCTELGADELSRSIEVSAKYSLEVIQPVKSLHVVRAGRLK